MFGLNPINLKALAVTAVVAFGAGTFGGGWAVWELWDLSAKRQEVATLKKRITAFEKASDDNTKKLQEDKAELDRRQEIIDELSSKVGPGVCLDGADADRLRDLWR